MNRGTDRAEGRLRHMPVHVYRVTSTWICCRPVEGGTSRLTSPSRWPILDKEGRYTRETLSDNL